MTHSIKVPFNQGYDINDMLRFLINRGYDSDLWQWSKYYIDSNNDGMEIVGGVELILNSKEDLTLVILTFF